MLLGEIRRREENVARLQNELSDLQGKVNDLDRTIARCDSRADPQASGVVRATSERYGGRGALAAFLREQVLAAGDQGIDTRTLCLQAMARFGLPVDMEADVNRFRANSIKGRLRHLAAKGEIEQAPRPKAGTIPAVWRPKRNAQSLADLRQATEENA